MTKEQSQSRSPERRQRVQSAEMGMGILKALARLGGVASLTAVAAEVDESTAKVHRYMASLSQEGLVSQDPSTQRYYLGSEAIQIGLAALRQCNPIRLGEQSLVRLREKLEVTCFIAIMGNKGPTILRFEEPGLPVTINVRAGSVLPMLWSATGRVFLSYLDDIIIRNQAEEELAQATDEQRSSLQDSDPIGSLRQAVRTRGSAAIKDTLLKGVSAVAAPIFDHTGRVSAVLTALGSASVFDTSPEGTVNVAVIREACDISAALGYNCQPFLEATGKAD
jgi:DNA-binding IclR family transcriptional regulator